MTLTTKGDANRGPDTAPVPVTAVRGKVLFHVPYLGTVRNAVGTGGFGLLVVMVALVGYSVSQLLSALRDRRHGTAAPLPRSSPEPGLQVQLLVASLPTASFTTLLPQHAAHLLQMDLLAEGTETFTVAACGVPAKLDQLVELLQLFAPVELVRSEVVSVPHCTSESRQRLAVDSAS